MSSRWQQPFDAAWGSVQQLQSEMNRLMNRFLGEANPFGGGSFPPLNVWEDGDAAHVEAELPGMNLNDLEIYVTGTRQLTLKGQRREPTLPEKCVWHRKERGFGNFARTVDMPFDVDADHVAARLESGVLHVTLPKHAAARARKVVVQGG